MPKTTWMTGDELKVEHWRPMVGRGGRYEVSDQGRVRSLWANKNTRRVAPQIRKTYYVNHKVVVTLANPRRSATVARLVLEAFVGPPPEGGVARHKDGDDENLNLSNLEWDATRGGNTYRIRFNAKAPMNDTATSRANCGICGESIWFDICKRTSRLLRMNEDMTLHAHQDETGDRT